MHSVHRAPPLVHRAVTELCTEQGISCNKHVSRSLIRRPATNAADGATPRRWVSAVWLINSSAGRPASNSFDGGNPGRWVSAVRVPRMNSSSRRNLLRDWPIRLKMSSFAFASASSSSSQRRGQRHRQAAGLQQAARPRKPASAVTSRVRSLITPSQYPY